MAWPDAWRALAAKELAGAGASATGSADARLVESLMERTLEGLTIAPHYGDGPLSDIDAGGWPGQAPFRRGSQAQPDPLRPWWNFSALLPSAPAVVHRQALEELEGGACGLEIPFARAGWKASELSAVLAGVQAEAIALRLDAGAEPRAAVLSLLELAHKAGAGGAGWCLGVDPLRVAGAEAAELEQAARATVPAARAFLADVTPFHEAGAHAVTDLAFALAVTAESLRALDAAGCAPDRALPSFAWRIPLERDFFGGVAKLRAARCLWAQMTRACGLKSPPAPFLYALTSPRTWSRRDPHTNLLRATVQSAAAMIGGADAISVQAFDAESARPSAHGRRLARTMQLVLQHEAGLGAVSDPAGGSPYLEERTRALAAAAWQEFRAIERGGGILRALRDGSLRARLDAEWETRRARIAAGDEVVLGVNLHQLAADQPAAALRPLANGLWDLPRHREEDACVEGA
jgi:methylmalonyl-CoA mutase